MKVGIMPYENFKKYTIAIAASTLRKESGPKCRFQRPRALKSSMGGNILNSEVFDFDAVGKLALLADILHLNKEGRWAIHRCIPDSAQLLPARQHFGKLFLKSRTPIIILFNRPRTSGSNSDHSDAVQIFLKALYLLKGLSGVYSLKRLSEAIWNIS